MLRGCNRGRFQFLEQIRLKTLQLFVPNSKRRKAFSRQQFLDSIRFKILQLLVPNSKRLGGYTQWVPFFLQKKCTSPRRLLQDKTTSRNHDKKKPDRAISEFFLIKNPGTHSVTFQDKTLQLLVPNSKRLGGYTQWVHFFLRKSARHQEDFFKTKLLQGLLTKRSRTELYPSSFQRTQVYAREPFNKESGRFQEKTLKLLVPNSQRLGGYIQMGVLFSLKRYTPREDLTKRYMVSLKKALGRRLFLFDKTWRNKTRLPELNHKVFGGFSILGCFFNQR